MIVASLTGIGHSVTPDTPSNQLVLSCLTPCQCIEVPLLFVSLFLIVISVLSVSIRLHSKLALHENWICLTERISPVAFKGWSRIGLVEQHALYLVPVGSDNFVCQI